MTIFESLHIHMEHTENEVFCTFAAHLNPTIRVIRLQWMDTHFHRCRSPRGGGHSGWALKNYLMRQYRHQVTQRPGLVPYRNFLRRHPCGSAATKRR